MLYIAAEMMERADAGIRGVEGTRLWRGERSMWYATQITRREEGPGNMPVLKTCVLLTPGNPQPFRVLCL